MILQSRPTAGRPDAPDPHFRTSAVLSGLAPRSEHATLSDDTSPSVTRVTGNGLQVDDTPSIEIAPSANAIATALQNTLVPRKRLLTHHTTRAHTHRTAHSSHDHDTGTPCRQQPHTPTNSPCQSCSQGT